MPTVEYYSQASPETVAADGYVFVDLTGFAHTSFAGIRNTVNGTGILDNDYFNDIGHFASSNAGQWVKMFRTIILFDTRLLPLDAIIDSARFRFVGINRTDNFADSLSLVGSNPVSNTGVVVADYSRLDTILLATPVTLASLVVDDATYNSIPLNIAGLAAIVPGGITKLGLRSEQDRANSPPAWVASLRSELNIRSADGGAARQPILEITYHTEIPRMRFELGGIMTTRGLQRNDYSRAWLIKWRAGPANTPAFEGFWKAGALDWSLGDVTTEYVPSPEQYGKFNVAGKVVGERGSPTIPITARYNLYLSDLLELAKSGCDFDVQIHMGDCQDPQDFNMGWTKILNLKGALLTKYGTTDLGALMPSERETVNEEVDVSAEDVEEIVRIVFEEQAASQITQQVIDLQVCDRATCGSCGIPSDGCNVVFGLTVTVGGSPGLGAELIYTDDGGETWDDRNITTLTPAEDPNGLACVGIYVVVVSEDSESIHYAPAADILAGTETWAEVTTGFVITHGPLGIFSLTPRHTWIPAEGGYIYFTSDITAGVVVQIAGSATVQDLQAIHGYDMLNLVAVGNSNAVLVTRNGGDTWATVTGPAVGVALNAVWMHTPDEWFVGSAAGRLYYTQDAGETWVEKAFPGSGAGVVRDLVFASETVGYMAHSTAAPAGRILRTVDGGHSWYVAPESNFVIPENDWIKALAVCEENVNVVYGGGLGGNALDGIIVKGSGG